MFRGGLIIHRRATELKLGSALLVIAVLLTGACASTEKPTRDMIYASAALKAAERAQAEKRSPDLFRRAENAYWKATRLYLAKEYKDAARAAFEARRLSEQSELDAEVKESLSTGGDGGGGF